MLAFFPDPLISISQIAAARANRINAARAVNPVFSFPDKVAMTSLGETSLVEMIFSNGSIDGGASRQQVDTFFREERLPFDQGYTVPATRITADRVTVMGQQITGATVPTDANNGTTSTAAAIPGSGRRTVVHYLASLMAVAAFAWSWL